MKKIKSINENIKICGKCPYNLMGECMLLDDEYCVKMGDI